jgi:hypothetical protein
MEGGIVSSEGYTIYDYVSLGPEPTLLTSKFHLLPLGLCLQTEKIKVSS